jgi:hypothetical protein
VTLSGSSLSNATAGSAAAPSRYLIDAPILIGASAAANVATFTFNQPVTVPAGANGNFLALSTTGAPLGGALVTLTGSGTNTITATFTTPVAGASRFAYVAAALPANNITGVRDTTTVAYSQFVPAVAPIGGRPSLVSIANVAGTDTWNFVFNTTIGNGAGGTLAPVTGNYMLITENGTVLTPVPGSATASGNTVTVTFASGSGAFANEDTVGTVLAGGAFAAAAGNPANIGDSAPIVAGGELPGLTGGPDLLSTTYNASTSSGTFTFDQPILKSSVGAGAYALITPGTNAVPAGFTAGLTVQSVTGNAVTIGFPNLATCAIGGAVAGAGTAFDGAPAPVSSSGLTNSGSLVCPNGVGLGGSGITGPTGPAGPTGAAGPAGAPGATGAPGAPGATGPAGPAGPRGLTGATGPRGKRGKNGHSACTKKHHTHGCVK